MVRKAFGARRHGWRRFASSGAAVLGVLGGILVTIASVQAVTNAASADPTSLGTTPAIFGYSEFSSGDSSLGSPTGADVAGTVVVGGNLNVPSGGTLTVGTAESGTSVLTVAGDVSGTGTVCIGGTNNNGQYAGTSTVQSGAGCGNLEQNSNLATGPGGAFQFIATEASTISSGWDSAPSDGTEQLTSGNLTLTGTASTVQVINVPSSDFMGAQTLTINVPVGTTQVLVNVQGPISGTPLPLASIIYPNGSAIAANTWLNFADATSVTFSNLEVNANVLAPNAVVTMSGGQFDGYVYAASIDGSFAGLVPAATTVTGPVPTCPCTTTTSSTTTSSTTTSSTTVPSSSTTTSSTTVPSSTTTSSTTTSVPGHHHEAPAATTTTTVAPPAPSSGTTSTTMPAVVPLVTTTTVQTAGNEGPTTTVPLITTTTVATKAARVTTTTVVPRSTTTTVVPHSTSTTVGNVTTTTTVAPTPTPPTTTPTSSSQLAFTGANTEQAAGVGLGLILAGGAVWLITGRRRRARP